MSSFRPNHPTFVGYYHEPGGMEPEVPFCIGCDLAMGTGHRSDCRMEWVQEALASQQERIEELELKLSNARYAFDPLYADCRIGGDMDPSEWWGLLDEVKSALTPPPTQEIANE